MKPDNKNNIYSKSTINELFHLIKSALIEEQLGIRDHSDKLSLIYEELADRDRLDVYDDAVSAAIGQSTRIKDLQSGFKITNIKDFSVLSRYEATELLRKAFVDKEDIEKYSSALKMFEIFKMLGMDDSSFTCEVTGQSMIEANIFEGDTLIVNRNKKIADGDIIVLKLYDELLVKKYVKKNGSEYLVSENSEYLPFRIEEKTEYEILGVVKSVIHKF